MKKHKSLSSLIIICTLVLGGILFLSNRKTRPTPVIAAVEDGTMLFATQNTPFTAEFGIETDPSRIAFKAGDTQINFKLPYSDIKWQNEGQTKITADIEGKKISYQLMQNKSGMPVGLKEEIILNEPGDENTFIFEMNLEGLTAALVNPPKEMAQDEALENRVGAGANEDKAPPAAGPTPTSTPGTKLWYFYNQQGQPMFYIPQPFMEDSAGAISTNVQISITGNDLTIEADKEWLNDPARKYPVTVDPSFVLVILTVHSHPRIGAEWQVDFTTQGVSDLKIIPEDTATIDDMDFVYLKCGEELHQAQMQKGDVIFYPDWECDATAQVSHLINREANHKLRFEFGGITAWAYNAGLDPDSSPASTMVTLEDIYFKLQPSDPATANVYTLSMPGTAPSSTMYTLQEIYDAAPDFNQNPGTATAGDVCNSATFYTDSISLVTGTRTSCSEPTGLPDTGQTTCYNDTTTTTCTGTEPSADFPRQDADYSHNPPSYTQYTYTVMDNVTGREWQRYGHGSLNGYTAPGSCATGGSISGSECIYSWQNALKYCANLDMDGKTDWRLPNAKELQSIVHYGASSPAINTSYFSNTASDYYWSSTTTYSNNSNAWYVNFTLGDVYYSTKTISYRVRCIRGE